MSEYQFIHFLAVDRPLDDDQLDYMRRQSTRAEITRWEFSNEYHFGDFRGNAKEMLRRGYDAHLHYANFGIRVLMFRLPAGLPCERKLFEAFLPEEGVRWHADPSLPAPRPEREGGHGGILEINPQADAGTYGEDMYDAASLLRDIVPVRGMLIAGDLRPLYLAWLACTGDDEAMEPPVPAGLANLGRALEEMASFYEIGPDLIAAAAERSPPLPETKADDTLKTWIARQSQKDLRELVERLLAGNESAARAEILASIRAEMPAAAWPMAEPTRTLAQLKELATDLHGRRNAREKKAAEAARRKRLEGIATDPAALIANVLRLVKLRSVDSYHEAAQQLADLREALGPEVGPARARVVAEKIRRQNPTRNQLVSVLRKHGLLG